MEEKNTIKANDFYNWHPEVEMAASGKARMVCILDFKTETIKYEISYIKNNKRKEVSFNTLENAARFMSEKV